MDIITDIRSRHETSIDAAKELGRGLMRGNRGELKLGYSWENAALAVIDAFELSKLDGSELRFHLLGFARGMHGVAPEGEAELVEKMHAISERYSTAYVAGRAAGLGESETKYPADLPGMTDIVHETDAAPKPRPTEEPFEKPCGCGATTVAECTAAREGYFSSLGQRSDDELHLLGDEEEGDGCAAARVVLVERRQQAEEA